MKSWLAKSFFCLALFLFGSRNVLAFSGSTTDQPYCDNHPGFCDSGVESSFTVTIPNADSAASDGTLTITTQGDMSYFTETLCIEVEGYNLGCFLNDNPNDDEFDNASFNDVGDDCGTAFTAPAVIPQANLNSIVSDGQIVVTVSSVGGNDINSFCNDPEEFVTFQMDYTSGQAISAVAVPTLGQWALVLLSGVLFFSAGFFLREARRKEKSAKLESH